MTGFRLEALSSSVAWIVRKSLVVDRSGNCLPWHSGCPQVHLPEPDAVGEEVSWVQNERVKDH